MTTICRLVLASVLVAIALPAGAVVDPHEEGRPERCLSCHTQVPSAEEVQAGSYHLLKASIDALCLVCHREEECCRTGQKHDRLSLGNTHRSDVPLDDVPQAHRPRTLPVQDGRITCYTCHLHTRQKPKDYKMVRLVMVKDTGVDWTALCHDCHNGF